MIGINNLPARAHSLMLGTQATRWMYWVGMDPPSSNPHKSLTAVLFDQDKLNAMPLLRQYFSLFIQKGLWGGQMLSCKGQIKAK